MRRGLQLFCVVMLVFAPGKTAGSWNEGKVVQYQRSAFSTDTAPNGTGHTTYRIEIDGGDRVYFVERTLNFAWQKFPALTENGPIGWRLKGKGMVICDDNGKEFTVTIVETRLKGKE
jgi:hypothetical protein